EKDWAKVEVRARFPGTILEKNVAEGDIVDTATDLFKVADLSRLAVWADAYEDDLPALLAPLTPAPLPPGERGRGEGQRRCPIRLKADPEVPAQEGEFSHISDVIDPTQHTALVTGHVDNRDGRLRAGQFITATVELPAAPDEVVLPAGAVIQDGRSS